MTNEERTTNQTLCTCPLKVAKNLISSVVWDFLLCLALSLYVFFIPFSAVLRGTGWCQTLLAGSGNYSTYPNPKPKPCHTPKVFRIVEKHIKS